MSRWVVFFAVWAAGLGLWQTASAGPVEDKIAQTAIEAVKKHILLPMEFEIKFIEEKKSAIGGFYAVKLFLSGPDRDIPVIVYVDQKGEKVILGDLYVNGENVTRREAGETKLRKMHMEDLDLDQSPSRGPREAKVTIVEFFRYQCPYSRQSWENMKGLLEKYPRDIRYVLKHFPLPSEGNSFDLAVLAAAAQEIGAEAFWVVHSFLFSPEGEKLSGGDLGALKKRIEEVLRAKGYEGNAIRSSWQNGEARLRVEEDLARGKKLRVVGTPTAIVNGTYHKGPLTEDWLENFLEEKSEPGSPEKEGKE
jgi:protein-disulfide isomerase